MGEHTASAFPPYDFGSVEREQNSSQSRSTAYTVHTRTHTAPMLAVFDMRAGGESFFHTQTELVTKLAVLLMAVVRPEWKGVRGIDWSQVLLFGPPSLAPVLELLRSANAIRTPSGQPHPILSPSRFVAHEWTPGLRHHFKRLLLLDIRPPQPLAAAVASGGAMAGTPKRSSPHLKLALQRTRQGWRVPQGPLYRLHYPRRAGLLLHRALLRHAAALTSEGVRREDRPRIVYYSRHDGKTTSRVVKGEKKLVSALRDRFGPAMVVYRHHPDAQSRLADAARTFAGATAVIGPHGSGLASLIYCDPVWA